MLTLDYRGREDHADWLTVIRLLAILCIAHGVTSGLISGFSGWYYFTSPARAGLLRAGRVTGISGLIIVLSLSALSNFLLVVAGVACLGRVRFGRRLAVICSLAEVLLRFANWMLGFLLPVRAYSLLIGLNSLPQVISAVVFPLAVALILSRRSVKQAMAPN